MSPIQIAQVSGLGLQKVSAILAELERNLFFLVRDSDDNVSWGFTVTTAQTPHRLTFQQEGGRLELEQMMPSPRPCRFKSG